MTGLEVMQKLLDRASCRDVIIPSDISVYQSKDHGKFDIRECCNVLSLVLELGMDHLKQWIEDLATDMCAGTTQNEDGTESPFVTQMKASFQLLDYLCEVEVYGGDDTVEDDIPAIKVYRRVYAQDSHGKKRHTNQDAVRATAFLFWSQSEELHKHMLQIHNRQNNKQV